MIVRTEKEIKAYVEGWCACHTLFTEYLGKTQDIGESCEKMDIIRIAVEGVVEREVENV